MVRHISLFLFFYCVAVHSAVNPILQVFVDKGGDSADFKLRLFDDVVPDTTDNFLNYVNGATVNGGDYDNTFFHRSVDGVVLQSGGFFFDSSAGGFTFDSATGMYTGGLQQIAGDAAIVNEPNLPNIRGSIGMAKKTARFENASGQPCIQGTLDCMLIDGTGPNSATSQWFVNLSDNEVFDDVNNNGGFTVFAEVVPDDIPVIDDLASVNIFDLATTTSFKALPLVGYTPVQPVQDNNLIKIISISELFRISDDIDFGDVDVGSEVDSTVTITALADKPLSIGDIVEAQLSAPFSIIPGSCKNTTIVANTSCDFTIRYKPVSIETAADKFDIVFTDPVTAFTLNVRASNAPDISLSIMEGEFGTITPYDPSVGSPEQIALIIENIGEKDLVFEDSEVLITAGDGSEFQIIDNCQNTTLLPESTGAGFSCAIPVNFVGSVSGEFSFVLTIVSNDPDQPRIEVPFTAVVVNDTDGVSTLLENNAPNNGDGNFDSKLDSLQSNVVSISDNLGRYTTFVTSNDMQFTNVTLGAITDFRIPYAETDSEGNVISFELSDISVGAAVNVGFILPVGFVYDDFKLLSLNSSTLKEEWIDSDLEGASGVISLGKTIFNSTSGNGVSRDVLVITFVDGGFGDFDAQANGVLRVTGLLLSEPESSSNSGELRIHFLAILFLLIIFFRAFSRRNYLKRLNQLF